MITPIKTKVLVIPDGKITETKSGIYTGAYSVEGSLRRGTVYSVGNKVRELVKGDRVCFQVYSGNILKDDKGTELFLLEEAEIIGKLEENL